MDARELLRSWPGWSNVNAETVLSSPAWRMPVQWKGAPAALVCVSAPQTDACAVRVAFDDEEHVLALGDSPAFPDLHQLWARRGDLPSEVLLALVEKECGDVFQMLENATRRLFSVRGLCGEGVGGLRAFRMVSDAVTVDFALDLSPALTVTFGDFAHLDLAHPSIRALARSAVPEYASFILDEDDRMALGAGDFLLLPDGADHGTWSWEPGQDDAVHVCGPESSDLTFAQIVDGDLPPTPSLADAVLVRGGRTLARAVLSRVGSVPALKVVEL